MHQHNPRVTRVSSIKRALGYKENKAHNLQIILVDSITQLTCKKQCCYHWIGKIKIDTFVSLSYNNCCVTHVTCIIDLKILEQTFCDIYNNVHTILIKIFTYKCITNTCTCMFINNYCIMKNFKKIRSFEHCSFDITRGYSAVWSWQTTFKHHCN